MIKFLTLLVLNFFDFFHKKKMLAFLKKNRFDNLYIKDLRYQKIPRLDTFISLLFCNTIYSMDTHLN